MSLLPNLDELDDEQKMAVLESVQKSIAQSKEIQKRKIGENVDLVVQALKKIEEDIRSRYDDIGNAIEKRVASIKDGRDGINGRDGKDGKDGKQGKEGRPGRDGKDGKNGLNGVDGQDGVSVVNAHIDFDGSLIISLSSGKEINVGEVVAPALAEQIKVITNGGGTSQSVLDTLTSLQSQIDAIGDAVVYKGLWNASTNSPTITSGVGTSGNFYIVSVAGSTNLDGITNWKEGDWAVFNGVAWQRVEGGADGNFTTVTASSLTSGRVTYAGAGGLLQDSSNLTFNGTTLTSAGFSGPLNGTVGATTPSTGAFTTLSSTGNTTLGDASTDTVTVNGYMGVGGGGVVGNGLQVVSSALSGVNQTGVYSALVGTSGGTNRVRAFLSFPASAAASYTVNDMSGFWAADVSKGAGSTITNLHGLYIADQTQGTNNYGITSLVSSGSNKWNIYANGTAANYFAGNVGIGTSSPNALLELAANNTGITTGAALNTLRFYDTDTSSAADQPFGAIEWYGADTSNTSIRAFMRVSAESATVPSYMSFGTATAAGSATERLRITSTGNVGIGRSPVTYGSFTVLDVAGASGAIQKWIHTGSTVELQAYANSSATLIGSATNHPLLFSTNNAERARIDSSGNVGIGTSSPTNKLTVDGNANITGNTTLGDATTDTVTVNGYMGVGGAAPNANRAVNAAISAGPTATTGVYGVYSSPTRTSAGNDTNFAAYNAIPVVNAAALTVTSSDGLYVSNATLTAGTLTNQHGVRISDLSSATNNYGITSAVSSGANKWNIYASGTAANYFAGNVGIGTSSPAGKLHIGGSASTIVFDKNTSGSDNVIFYDNTTASNNVYFGRDSSNLVLRTANSERMRIDSSGNVGIGTTSPATKLDVNGSLTFDGAVASPYTGFKNKIIGGDFTTNPWQRGTSFTAPASGDYTADRWRLNNTTAAVVNALKTADAPTAAQAGIYTSSCFHVDVTTADASIAAGEYMLFNQRIEGYNAAPFGFGQAGTRYVTLSFWHKHTKTGTYCASLLNSAANRSYVAEYTQDVTDTWEKATITMPVDTSGTWLYDNGIGLFVIFSLAAGSTYQTTAGAWASGLYYASSNQVNALDSTANNFKIALVQLEAGQTATSFETRSVGQELALCQRYYFRASGNTNDPLSVGFNIGTTQATCMTTFQNAMRTAPTALEQTGVATDYKITNAGDTTCSSVPSFLNATQNMARTMFTVASGLTAGYGAVIRGTTSNVYLAWSAEL